MLTLNESRGPVGVAGGKLQLLKGREARCSTDIERLLGSGGVKDSSGVCGEVLSALWRIAIGLAVGAGRESDLVRDSLCASNNGKDRKDLLVSGEGVVSRCGGCIDWLRDKGGEAVTDFVNVMNGMGESSIGQSAPFFSARKQGVEVASGYLQSSSTKGGDCSRSAGDANVSGPNEVLLPNKLLRRLLLLPPFDCGRIVDVDFVGVGGKSSTQA